MNRCGETCALKQRRSQSGRGRKGFEALKDFRRGCKEGGANHFVRGRQGCRRRQYKCPRNDGGPPVVRAAGHRASRHAPHIVAAIHGLRIVRRGRLPALMRRFDGAEAAGATAHTIGDQRRRAQRGVEQRHGQHAKACRCRAKAFCLCPAHENESHASFNDTPARRGSTAAVSGKNPSAQSSLPRLRRRKNSA